MTSQFLRSKFSGLLFVFVLLGLWEAASRAGFMNPRFVPAVSAVIERLAGLSASGELPRAFLHTFERIAQGYGWAALLGVGVGLAVGSMPAVYRMLSTTLELLRPLPSAAIIPVAMLFLGLGDVMKVFIIAWACFFPILLSTMHGVRGIERTLLDTGRTFRFGRARTMARLILPAASPAIATGLRISLALALILGVTTELVAGENGIGFFILRAQRSFRAAEMYAGVVALGVAGYALNWLFMLAEGRLLGWHHVLTTREASR